MAIKIKEPGKYCYCTACGKPVSRYGTRIEMQPRNVSQPATVALCWKCLKRLHTLLAEAGLLV